MYESEITRFMRDLLDRNPKLKEMQRSNRATWWDKPQDLGELEERAATSVGNTGYAYFPVPRAANARPEKD